MRLKKYYITTFGCQANLADSERIVKILKNVGYAKADNESKCNLLVFNTCSVRQSAEDRVFGLNKKLKELKSKNKQLRIILAGCMLHYGKKELHRRMPDIDYFIDTKEIDRLPKVLRLKKLTKKLDGRATSVKTNNKYSALIPISHGCNNFCSYCIVPYARGREESRSINKIIKEVKEAINPPADGGAKEVWLLGQNVNSYKYEKIKFPKLLRMINAIPGDFWIRFASPHPKDFSDEMIKAMTECKKFPHYLHLPIQSGNNAVLKKMNRPYTVAHYKKLIRKIRKAIPDIAISTDIIVGFPGETKEQFEDTAKLMEEIKFDMAFISEYSPRSKTLADKKYKDDVPHEEKKRRKKHLNDEVLAKTGLEHNEKIVGQTVRCFADKKGNIRTAGYKLVKLNYKKTKSPQNYPIGKFFNIKITKAGPWKLWGEVVM